MVPNICIVEECDSTIRSSGYCSKHYQRVRKYGSPHAVHKSTGGVDASVDADGMLLRIKAKTERRDDGCWVWTDRLNDDGYAEFRHDNMLESVHRYSYRLFIGPIPEGLEVDHLCNNRACLEPSHLEAVTQEENKRRTAERRTTCRSGRHPWVPENIYEHGGCRKCRSCHLEAVRRYQRRKKLAA